MEKTVAELIRHPELLGEDTLYGLRELVARYPYFQAARLLLLHNLFLLHDPTFGAELRRAAVFLPDRSVLFRMVEGDNYEIKRKPSRARGEKDAPQGDRTQSLIDDFLSQTGEAAKETRRKPTAADAMTDYTAFLLQMDDAEPEDGGAVSDGAEDRSAQLIDGFMEGGTSRIRLPENPELVPEEPEPEMAGSGSAEEGTGGEDGFLTMTLAKIYIKQGRYEKALDIMRKVGASSPKKQAYFADQVRFLLKLIVNSSHSPKK